MLLLAMPAQGQPTSAELQDAAHRDPTSVRAWDRLGQQLARERRFAEAMLAFGRALALAPQDKEALNHQALAYAWGGNYAEAARRYEELLARYPEDSAIHLDYGELLAWDRHFAEARAQYEHVLSRNPEHVEGLRRLALLNAWQGAYGEALNLLARAAKRAPNSIHVLATQGEVLTWNGDLAAATASFQKILDIAPGDAGALTHLGRIYGWQGRVHDAQEFLRRAIAADRMAIEAYLGLSDIYLSNHQYTQAEQTLRRAQSLFPTDNRIGERVAGLAAQQRLSPEAVIEHLEPLLFVIVLAAVFQHTWRYRRALGSHNPLTRAPFLALPVLAGLLVLVYGFSLAGVGTVREMAQARQVLELLGLATLLIVFLALVWLLRFEHPWRRQTVLAIGAHPDDIEFGCGATLLRLREEGATTHALVLTGGEQGVAPGMDPALRVSEAQASGRVIALSGLTVLNFPDTQLAERKDDIKQAIEREIARLKPDIVFTHTLSDLHSDHKAVFEATCVAARGAMTLLCYENPNTPPGFQPSYFVDVAEYLDEKLAALARHKSQAGKAYIDPHVVRHAAGFRGAQARIKYAEAFEVQHMLEKPLRS